jgi:hypothetical protein
VPSARISSSASIWVARPPRAAPVPIRALAPLEFVNGGGTGSLETTAADLSATELAAGSGLMGPTLFDAYRRFSPRPARRRHPPRQGLTSQAHAAQGPFVR